MTRQRSKGTRKTASIMPKAYKMRLRFVYVRRHRTLVTTSMIIDLNCPMTEIIRSDECFYAREKNS